MFKDNLVDGICYYKDLISKITHETDEYKALIQRDLTIIAENLDQIVKSNKKIFNLVL